MNKWIIFGTSPFINDIKDFSFAENYNTIALNNFNSCKTVYRCAYDSLTIANIENKKYGGLRLYNKKAMESLIVTNKLFFDRKIEIKAHYLFDYSPQIVTKECGKLYGCDSSAIPAINYVILQEAKYKQEEPSEDKPIVYLIGVDFNWNKGHCYRPKKRHKPQDKLFELRKNIKQLRNYVDIYRVNPDNSLLLSFLPLKRINEL